MEEGEDQNGPLDVFRTMPLTSLPAYLTPSKPAATSRVLEYPVYGDPPGRNSLQSTFEAVPVSCFLASWHAYCT
jgi:hypothetical protein